MNVIEKKFKTHNWANALLLEAIEDVDGHLGEGYAAKHPELIAAYLNAAGADNSEIARCLTEINETLQRIYRRFDTFADGC
ncbi:MAG: hypothetical protein WAW61_11505 [Methylococcaceae bacterium]